MAQQQYRVSRLPHVCLVLLAVLGGACGGDTPTSPSNEIPTADSTAIAVTCTTSSAGHDCRASLERSSGPAQDVTATATWTSSNTAVATVDTAGHVTHRGSGQTEIRAAYQDHFGGAIILVNVSVTSLSVACVPEGASYACTSVANFSNGTTQDVTRNGTAWSTSNPAIATIDSTGRVTPVGTGQVDIAARFQSVVGGVTLTLAAVALSGASVVLNEFATRGPDASTDDFIELRNDTSSSVDISGWRINEWRPTSGVGVRFVVPAGVVLAPGCHYLVAWNTDVRGVSADARLLDPVNDQGGLALQHSDGSLVDQVGYHPSSIYREGTPMPLPGPEDSRSYARVGNDTNNNINDFIRQSRSPLNSASSCAIR